MGHSKIASWSLMAKWPLSVLILRMEWLLMLLLHQLSQNDNKLNCQHSKSSKIKLTKFQSSDTTKIQKFHELPQISPNFNCNPNSDIKHNSDQSYTYY